MWMEAAITADTITIQWVSDNGDTKSLYWKGTYTAPDKAGTGSGQAKETLRQCRHHCSGHKRAPAMARTIAQHPCVGSCVGSF